MGTRSMHILPSDNKGNFICQYLQFDGYPEHQLAVLIKDINRVSMSIRCGNKKIDKDVFYNFIRSYYKYRSFETPHSVNNSVEVDSYNVEDFTENWWCEWSYEWIEEDENIFLKVTRLSDMKCIKVEINEMFEIITSPYAKNVAPIDKFLEKKLQVFEKEE